MKSALCTILAWSVFIGVPTYFIGKAIVVGVIAEMECSQAQTNPRLHHYCQP